MRTIVSLLSVTVILCALPAGLAARTINIPADEAIIQAGIDAAEAGDTVLVQPGHYVENINFNGREVVVGSLFLTTGDIAYIDSTIIDGDQNGHSVVVARNGESREAELAGFTLENASTDYGGGVYLREAGPSLHHLIIRNNSVTDNGGGIYCAYVSDPKIENVLIENNEAESGAGISIWGQGRATVKNAVIRNNTANSYGGGIQCSESSVSVFDSVLVEGNVVTSWGGGGVFVYVDADITLRRCSLIDNQGDCGSAIAVWYARLALEYSLVRGNLDESGTGAIYISSGEAELTNITVVANQSPGIHGDGSTNLKNSIVWNNAGESVSGVSVTYSDIEGGAAGEGNIEADPLFADPDAGDYRLAFDSPCIDSGDPESPRDPDSTRADMGAFYFPQNALLYGYLYDSMTGLPLAGGRISTTFITDVRTDETGLWVIYPVPVEIALHLTASMPGYLDSTSAGIELAVDDTLRFDLRLLRPVFTPSPEGIVTILEPDSLIQVPFSVQNLGNGGLDWSVRRGTHPDVPPWQPIRSFHVGQMVQDSRIEGVAFAEERFFVSGGGNEINCIYVFDSAFNLVDMFPQPDTTSLYGMKNLAWDGELIWGGIGKTLYCLTPAGQILDSIITEVWSIQGVAWDPDRELIWTASITGREILGYNRFGILVERVSQSGLYVFGLAYFPNDPEHPLYALNAPDLSTQIVTKINPDDGDTMFVTQLDPEGGDSPRGTFITNQYERFAWTWMSVSNDATDDRVDLWMVSSDPTWLAVEPVMGAIAPQETQEFLLTISAAGLEAGRYDADLAFNFPAVRSGQTIPVTLSVELNGVPAGTPELPVAFGIGSIYPNPFNSRAVSSYKLQVSSWVKLGLYDITGRLALTLADGVQMAGEHRVVIDGSTLASGIYWARLESAGRSDTKKLVCVK